MTSNWLLYITVIALQISTIEASTSSTDITSRLQQNLEIIKAFTLDTGSEAQSANELAGSTQNTISALSAAISSVGSTTDGSPNNSRIEFIQRIATIIQPYNSALLKLGFSSGASETSSSLYNIATQCRSLLDYTQPDQTLEVGLRTHTSGLNSEASNAYDLLFQHRLLNTTESAELVRRVLNEEDTLTRERWAVKCGEMCIPGILPVLQEMLEIPFVSQGTVGSTGIIGENDILTKYREAIEAINTLGSFAAALLPILQERMKEVSTEADPEIAPIYAAKFRAAIQQVQGKKPTLVPTARNGSGPLVSLSSLPHRELDVHRNEHWGAPSTVRSPYSHLDNNGFFFPFPWLWATGCALLLIVLSLIKLRRR